MRIFPKRIIRLIRMEQLCLTQIQINERVNRQGMSDITASG